MIDYVQLLDHLSIGTAVVNPALEIVFWNKWMAEHSTIAREEAVGQTMAKLFPVLVKKNLIKKTLDVFKSGKPVFFTHKVHQTMFPFYSGRSYLEKNLTAMQQTVILSPLKDDQGETKQVLISVFDITDWVIFQNQLLKSKKELEKLSQIDDLTHIPNRRNIMERLKDELVIHIRKKRPMALAIIDIDKFKQVNDNYGHQCGDFVLFEIARVLTSKLRGYDALGRYGGEEFMLILPEATREESIITCERLRKSVGQHLFKYLEIEIRVTISIGIAFKDEREIMSADELFRIADHCLYLAKEGGRNLVVAQDAYMTSADQQ